MPEDNRAKVLSEKIMQVIIAATKRGELPPRTDNARLVLIVECDEPDLGPDTTSLSVLRNGCDPCEAAAVCTRVVEDHIEEFHQGAESEESDDTVH